jgi:multiple antibiotic resistance protein
MSDMSIFANVPTYFFKFFVAVNPLVVVPFFLACTQNYTTAERRIVAGKMCLYGLMLIILFAACGNTILDWLGVSVAAFSIGGGVILANAAWGLLFSDLSPPLEETSPEIAMRRDISMCPLAFPIFIGPATLTFLVNMVCAAKEVSAVEPFVVTAVVVLFVGITYILTLFGDVILKLLGRNGAMIISRVGGIFLFSISIGMIATGIKTFFNI